MIYTQLSFAQLKRGDIAHGFYSTISTGTFYSGGDFSQFNATFSPSVGVMLNDRIMLGTGIGITGSESYYTPNVEFSSNNYHISPFFRYYFFEKRNWMPFAFVQGSFSKWVYSDNTILNTEPHWNNKIGGGMGIDYFIAPNIALEGKITTRIYDNYQEPNTYSGVLSANIGIKTFISDRTFFDGGIKNNYLKKGNYVLGGNAFFNTTRGYDLWAINLGESGKKYNGYRFGLYPSLKYFKTDNWAINGGISFSHQSQSSFHLTTFGLNAGSEVYFPINEKLYFVPSADVGWGHRISKTKEIIFSTGGIFTPIGGITPGTPILITADTAGQTQHFNNYFASVSSSIKYFSKKNTILSAGTDLISRINYYNGDKRDSNTQFSLHGKCEYFFAKNINLYAMLNYTFYESRRNYNAAFTESYSKSHRLGLIFGMNYFIFNSNNDG